MTLRAYAERIGVSEDTVTKWKHAADVAVSLGGDFESLTGHMKHLAAIHAAPVAVLTGQDFEPADKQKRASRS
jgi:hypothetical protein